MQIVRWFAWRQWPWLPTPVRAWQERYKQAAIYALLAPRVLGNQAAGITETWATPDTTAADVLGWIPEQFTPSPDPQARTADWVKVLIAHVSEADQQRSDDGEPLNLPADALIATWFGPRQSWFWDGHDAVAAAMPDHHSGLYIAVNAVAASVL